MTDHRSVGRWRRIVTTKVIQGTSSMEIQQTEDLDMRAASKRLMEVIHERPDAGVMAWLDCALNGWGDE